MVNRVLAHTGARHPVIQFLASSESPVHTHYKQAVLAADETGTVVVNRTGSPTMRVLGTEFSRALAASGGPAHSSLDAINRLYFDGEMEASLASAGQSVGLVHDVVSVATIIENTMAGFRAAMATAVRRAGEV
ncbi:hypothetical protein [Embleya sp. NPDC005575]|uniref:hypothetical protein n=1 Tax=Embleya sp. NPDC005575 TaxID=3156892 RepID=UPI0033B6B8FD